MLSSVLMSLRRFRRALPVGAFLFAFVIARAGSDDFAGTLPEDYLPELKPILQAALKQSPQVIAKEIEIAQSEARAMAVDAQRLPSLGGHLDYAYNQTAISGNSGTQTRDSGVFYGLALNQPLFHWGALANQSAAARIEVSIAEKNFAETYRLVAVNLRQQYLTLIAKNAVLRQARFALAQSATDLQRAKDDRGLGNVSPATSAAQQLSFDEASLGVERVEAEFAGLQRGFARLAGIDQIAEDAIPLEIGAPHYSAATVTELLAGLVRDGAKSTFEAQVRELQMHEADLNYKIASVRLRPNINAGASLNQENTTNATTTSVLQQGVARQTATVTMQWSIFDGYATQAAKRDALASKRLHERELKTAVQGTLDQAQTLQRQIGIDARAMELTETHRKLAEDQLAKAKEGAALGDLRRSAIAGATNLLYYHEANNTAARATFLAHWAELVSLVGTDPVLNNLPANYVREKR
jgi:outer membrane protein TolC